MTGHVYSDEDNVPMRDDTPLEYTGIINDTLFRETGECVVRKVSKKDD